MEKTLENKKKNQSLERGAVSYLVDYFDWPCAEEEYDFHLFRLKNRKNDKQSGEARYGSRIWPVMIKTFGGFSLSLDEKVAQFQGKAQRKPFELLKTLIAYGGYNICEEKLSEALWPDADGDTAHRSYNTTLHRLRKLIGNSAITVNQGKASLDCQYCWLDIWSYLHLCDQLEKLLQNRNSTIDQIHHTSEHLLSIYQGPFLENDIETTALLILREKLRSRLKRILKLVVVRYTHAGQCEYALKLYQKALEVDELSEELYRGVIACYAALGFYSEALAAYENCRRVLKTIFDIAPSRQTQLLRHAIVTSGNNRLSRDEIKKFLFFPEKNVN